MFDFTFWYLFATKDIEKEYRIQHKVYHHTLKSNFSSNEATWHRKYKICTDSRGFKFDCKSSELNKYDFAFIGDSFIEGIGFPYEKTFVGLVDKKSNFKIINLSVSSYSPVIYYYKVREFIKSNLRFDHLVVFMDISNNFSFVTRSTVKTKETIK